MQRLRAEAPRRASEVPARGLRRSPIRICCGAMTAPLAQGDLALPSPRSAREPRLRPRDERPRSLRHLLTIAGLAASGLAFGGCASQEQFGGSAVGVVGKGVVNNPSNKSLRFDILRFGLDRFCAEMMERGTPLKLHDDQPVMGRFFAEGCQSQVFDDDQRNTFVVQFSGRGYAWTNLTGRIGFRTRGLVELAPDFRLHDEAMYVYFRAQKVDASDFELLLTEATATTQAARAAGVDANRVGRAIVDGQLRRGFTVIRFDQDGHMDFELGLVPPGEVPFRPYTVISSSRMTLNNGRTEVYQEQQDFIGRFKVTDSDQALTLTMKLDGAPAVDVAVMHARNVGPMLDRYLTAPGAAQLSAHPVFSTQLAAGAPLKVDVPLPEGEYFLLIDNSSAVGTTAPASSSAAKVDYLVQLGDAP